MDFLRIESRRMSLFGIYIILSFAVAGAWIGAATVVAERYGSRIGGLIATLPSTIVVSFIFIAITQGLEFTAQAAKSVATGMSIDTVFLLAFVAGLKINTAIAVVFSLGTWAFLAFFSSSVRGLGWSVDVAIYFGIVVVVFLIMDRVFHLKTSGGEKKRYSIQQIALRITFAGAVVASSVICARYLGAYWAGIFSTFPAVMLSTLVILTVNNNAGISGGAAKILAVSSTNIVIFAFSAYNFYPWMGLLLGTVGSYLASAIWLVMIWPLIRAIR